MKSYIFLFFLLLILKPFAQNNTVSLNSFYKDQLYAPQKNGNYQGGDFLPITENEYNLPAYIADSAKQYYQITTILFKKHLIELKGQDYYFTISPVMNVSLGKNKDDGSLASRKFQNTRGFIVEGDFFKNVSFSSSFYENQARFTEYQSEYYKSVGELYPSGKGYNAQNAVVNGGARTKPFKTDGFDYAYAFGNVVYKINKKVTLIGGNDQHFIGAGYRSLLLSDNSLNSPYIQGKFRISDKFSFVYMRARMLNLLRRPFTSSAEAYYEPKAFSTNYLTYKASDKLIVSLFDGGMWSKGDSVTSTKVNGMFYNPVPFLSQLVVNDDQLFSLSGLNVTYAVNNRLRLYGQLATSDFKTTGYQLGLRLYNFASLKKAMLQFEYNNVPSTLYLADNSRLSYSNANLPLAHTKGNGFQEFVGRISYEYERFYVDVKMVFYSLKDHQNTVLNAYANSNEVVTGNIQHQVYELGYRFNRKINLELFGNYLYRQDQTSTLPNTQFFSVGIRTGLLNHYNDF
jgi:hypothetical protein